MMGLMVKDRGAHLFATDERLVFRIGTSIIMSHNPLRRTFFACFF